MMDNLAFVDDDDDDLAVITDRITNSHTYVHMSLHLHVHLHICRLNHWNSRCFVAFTTCLHSLYVCLSFP